MAAAIARYQLPAIVMKAHLLAILLLLSTGCAYRHQQPAPISYLISDEACHPTVTLTRCRQADPHSCHRTIVRFKSGCEQLQVSK